MSNARWPYWLALTCVCVWALCGCDEQSPQTKPDITFPYRYPTKHYDLPYVDAFEFQLEDGTRCVYMSQHDGITCDRKSSKGPE